MDKKPKLLSNTSNLLERFCKPTIIEGIIGDLEEAFFENKEQKGAFRAKVIHLFQVIGFLRPRFRRRSKHSNFEAMLRNYLVATIRNLSKHKFYSAINIFGLAVGMTAGFMILQHVYHEMTYDHFIEEKENIYRIQTNRYNDGELTTQWAGGAAGAGYHLNTDFPEVIDFVNLTSSRAIISYDEKYFELAHPYYAGKNFFEFFSIPLMRGVDSTALDEPFTVVLSESLAGKIFGDEDPVGKVVKQNDSRDFKVTGVFKDFPERSHMKFDLLYSFETFVVYTSEDARTEWNWDGFLNYVKLHPEANPVDLSEKFPSWIRDKVGEELDQYNAGIEFVLQPLTKIHLISNYRAEIKPTGDEKTTQFLLIIGLFVLFIAWINYINLTTARALSRAKEVGIRKVMGGFRRQLIGQFMFESCTINVLAFLTSTILILLLFPSFNEFVGRNTSYTWPDASFFWIGIAVVFIAGIALSGFYPAFVLSSFKPISVLKGKFSNSTSGNLLRKGLVTFQFLASVVLITSTFVVYKQMNFLQSQDLGVNIDQNLVIKTPTFQNDSIRSLRDDFFRNKLDANPSVATLTASTAVPGRTPDWNAGGIRLISETDAESNQYRVLGGDDKFIDFYGLEIVAGRKFDRSYSTEESNVLFSEKAVEILGFSDSREALNQKIFFWGDTFNIVGVVKDYRQESPKQAFDALIFRYFPSSSGYYSVNINTSNMRESLDAIQADWEAAFGNKIFDFFFLDDYYNEQYESEVKFGSIFGLFSMLAILVACLGLFGLASYVTSLRSKEVGVRKVLGASIQQLLKLLTWDFIKLVGISIIIAAPLSWWLMKNWLAGFENRIQLGVGVFLIPAITIIIIAISTVAFHTIKTAKLNPADTLHDE
ncbi:ABC transporter permease [Ekhidna sp.]|uniref:ABC transporter permease n=1 Tax=Ekhidna sp. TaxID=2608089 RepID=UPI003298B7D0